MGATTTELNILDGVTATTTELNNLAGVTLGTSSASKVVTADANNDVSIDTLTVVSSYTGPSDRRLKTDIRSLTSTLDKIKQLHGVTYYWDHSVEEISGYDHDKHVGLLAQDVQAVFPDLVRPFMNNSYLSVNYIGIIPVLVEAVKELADREHAPASGLSDDAVESRHRQLQALADQHKEMLSSQKMMISALEDRLNTLQAVLIMMSIAFCLN